MNLAPGPENGMDIAGVDSGEVKGKLTAAREDLRVSKEVAKVLGAIRLMGTKLRMYGPEHEAVLETADTVMQRVADSFDSVMDATLSVSLTAKGFECRTIPLYDVQKQSAELIKHCERCGIGHIHFHRGVTRDEVVAFGCVLFQHTDGDQNFPTTLDKMTGLKVRHITVEETQAEDEREGVREASAGASAGQQGEGHGHAGALMPTPRLLYEAMVAGLKDTQGRLAQGEEPDYRSLQSVCGDLATMTLAYRGAMLPYAMVRGRDPFHATHPVHVALLATAMATGVMEAAHELAEVAMSAMLMDLGEPVDAGRFQELHTHQQTSSDWHPLRSALLLDKALTLSKMPMVVAFEHHLHEDGGGLPRTGSLWQRNVVSEFIGVARRFDVLCAGEGDATPCTPSAALHALGAEAGQSVSSLAFDALAALLGPCPPGSVLVLGSGEYAIVYQGGQPLHAVVMTDPHGTPRVAGEPRSVWLESDGQAEPRACVGRMIEPRRLALDPFAYLPDERVL